MASDSLLFLALAVVFPFICCEASNPRLLTVECQPAVGVVGETMKISCSFKCSSGYQDINIILVSVYKSDPENPVFSFRNKISTGDTRFKLLPLNNPSLELTSAAVTDEGRYTYKILTNRGFIQDGSFSISVTAKYSEPTTSSWPEVIEDGGSADLYCSTSGGYPAGAIHWFDATNTNWTKSSTLEITEGEDKLVQLSSKLTFSKIDSTWAPFRCVVVNSKFIREGEKEFHPKIKEGQPDEFKNVPPKLASTSVVAPVVVIGSLLVGLLLVILLRGRCSRGHSSDQAYIPPKEPDVEKALNPVELEAEKEDTQLKAEGGPEH